MSKIKPKQQRPGPDMQARVTVTPSTIPSQEMLDECVRWMQERGKATTPPPPPPKPRDDISAAIGRLSSAVGHAHSLVDELYKRADLVLRPSTPTDDCAEGLVEASSRSAIADHIGNITTSVNALCQRVADITRRIDIE